MNKRPKRERSLQNAILEVLQWMAAGAVAFPIYFAIEGNAPKLVIALIVGFPVVLLYLLLAKVPLSDSSLDPNSQGLPRNKRTRASRHAYVLANSLTFVRPTIGVAAGLAVARGNVGVGFSLFLAGLTSDVLDGMIARLFHVQSAHGRKWDAIADVIHNFSFAIGLAWAASKSYLKAPTISVLFVCLLVFIVQRRVVPLHSVVDKCLSGVWRVVLFFVAYSLLPPSLRPTALVAGAMLATLGGTYEIGVLSGEIRSGERVVWRRRRGPEVRS